MWTKRYDGDDDGWREISYCLQTLLCDSPYKACKLGLIVALLI